MRGDAENRRQVPNDLTSSRLKRAIAEVTDLRRAIHDRMYGSETKRTEAATSIRAESSNSPRGQQPDTPVYATNLDANVVRRALSEASKERKPEWRQT